MQMHVDANTLTHGGLWGTFGRDETSDISLYEGINMLHWTKGLCMMCTEHAKLSSQTNWRKKAHLKKTDEDIWLAKEIWIWRLVLFSAFTHKIMYLHILDIILFYFISSLKSKQMSRVHFVFLIFQTSLGKICCCKWIPLYCISLHLFSK